MWPERPLNNVQVCSAAAGHKRESRENRLRSRHCERRALRVLTGEWMSVGTTEPAVKTDISVSREPGGKVEQGRENAVSQETCLDFKGGVD